MLFSIVSLSQEISTIDSVESKAQEQYCMVIASSRVLSTKVSIEVDFGQAWSRWKDKRSLRDEQGKKIVFNSIIEALNYMAEDGWVLVNTFVLSDDDSNVVHYILKRSLQPQRKDPKLE